MNNKIKSDFKLVGLSKAKSATLELIDTDRETFWATIDMTQEKFDSMWKYCENNWSDKKIAEVVHDGFYADGTPKNPVMTGFREV